MADPWFPSVYDVSKVDGMFTILDTAKYQFRIFNQSHTITQIGILMEKQHISPLPQNS